MAEKKKEKGDVSIHLSLPSDMELISSIRQFVGQVARKQGFGEEDAHDVEIALSEALTNVVEHGYPPHNTAYRVDVTCEIDASKCVLILHDEGKVFDPVSATIPPISEQRRERDFHLGTFYIRRCMDDVHYATRAQKNTLTMTKFRGGGRPAKLTADR